MLQGLSTPWAGNRPLATLALSYLKIDEQEKAKKIMKELNDKGDNFATGLIYAALGDRERALEYFQQVEY